jgi:hypothetical protein
VNRGVAVRLYSEPTEPYRERTEEGPRQVSSPNPRAGGKHFGLRPKHKLFRGPPKHKLWRARPKGLHFAVSDVGDRAKDSKAQARRGWSWPTVAVMVILLAVALAWGGWLVSGGRLFWVGSPSMGTVAPVGSLVAVHPLGAGKVLHVGEVIVFRPRLGLHETFIHRIYRILVGPRYMTKGILNPSPDPWTITRGQIVGTPAFIIPAIGWAYKLAAWLFLGSALLIVLSMLVRDRARGWITILGPVGLVILPMLRYRVLMNSYLYGAKRDGHLLKVQLVDSGVLPVRFGLKHGSSAHAVPGQEVVVHGVLKQKSQLLVTGAATLPWWGWAIVALVCLTPFLLRQITIRHFASSDADMSPEAGHSELTLNIVGRPRGPASWPKDVASRTGHRGRIRRQRRDGGTAGISSRRPPAQGAETR